MKTRHWFVFASIGALSGCGELMFGPSDTYALGSTSCRDIADSCGPQGTEDCCMSPVVEGISAEQASVTSTPTTSSDFRLDRFEVTVGRFRAFVDAYPHSRPAAGNGGHPRIAQSGWNSDWDSVLPADRGELVTRLHCNLQFDTFTDTPTYYESFPVNCVDWYLAFAFCAWDGGRLPTEAEWNHAARGGLENRRLPWSAPPSSEAIDPGHATYDCLADGMDRWQCIVSDIHSVGTHSPLGDGFFGQADLAGNMREWTLDAYHDSAMTPCDDCAYLREEPSTRVLRGGAWDLAAESLLNSSRDEASPGFRYQDIGFRCARSR